MIVVVADTSPIYYLGQIGAVEVLPRFFDEVILPQTVHHELQHPATPRVVREWITRSPVWLVIRAAANIPEWNLDAGEAEAIALAKELGAWAVLLDDSDGRRVARQEGLHVAGTIGILERAAAAGLVDLPEMISRLRATTFRASEELLQAALRRDAERKR